MTWNHVDIVVNAALWVLAYVAGIGIAGALFVGAGLAMSAFMSVTGWHHD